MYEGRGKGRGEEGKGGGGGGEGEGGGLLLAHSVQSGHRERIEREEWGM